MLINANFNVFFSSSLCGAVFYQVAYTSMIKFWGKKAKAWMGSCHVVEISGIEALHKMQLRVHVFSKN